MKHAKTGIGDASQQTRDIQIGNAPARVHRPPARSRSRSACAGYDRDFFQWTVQQTSMIRAGRLALADLVHIAEEIED